MPKSGKLSDIQVIHDAQAKHKGQTDNAPIKDAQDRPLNQVGGHLIIQIGMAQTMIKTIKQGLLLPAHPKRTHNQAPLMQEKPHLLEDATLNGIMAPLASWNNITSGCRCRLNINHTPQVGIPNVAVVSPNKITHTDCVQTDDEMPVLVRPRHALANWTSFRLGNTPNRPMVNKETGKQPQMMMVADSNIHGMTSEDTESANSVPIYSDYGSELNLAGPE